MILLMAVGVNNAYNLTLLNVTHLPGNKFLNGLVLGVGEMTSGFFSGVLIAYSNANSAFQALGILGISLNAVNQFWAAEGSFIAYFSLFFAVLGVGGVYASLYVLIADSVPTSKVGTVMVISCTVGVLSTAGAPLVVLVSSPFPYFFLAAMLLLAVLISCCHKRFL